MEAGFGGFLSGDLEEDSPLFRKLDIGSELNQGDKDKPDSYIIAPKAGFCLKTHSSNGEKVFVNVCTSEYILPPPDVSEAELRQILDECDPTKYRVPMSIGEPHIERDKTNKECSAYDVGVHPSFYKKLQENEFFKEFFISILFEGLEAKYELELARDYVILKNRKAMGSLQLSAVKTTSTPVIMEMNETDVSKPRIAMAKVPGKKDFVIKEISTKGKETGLSTNKDKGLGCIPQHHILFKPSKSDAEKMIMDVYLPSVEKAQDLILDVSEDWLILTTSGNLYHIDMELPRLVENNQVTAEFNRDTKVLSVSMKIMSSS